MTQELTVDGKLYASSKQAAERTGYAQDYIGQLARKQLIDARRIGGLWYIQMDSLTEYKREADEYKPQPPAPVSRGKEVETVVSFDGKEYVSAARAAELTGYHQDYIGQLARNGSVLSRQIGNRWYVDHEGLIAHKKEKDAMLAAVQADAVGLHRGSKADEEEKRELQLAHTAHSSNPGRSQAMNYFSDQGALMPDLVKNEEQETNEDSSTESEEEPEIAPTQISIHRIRTRAGDEVLAAKHLAVPPARREKRPVVKRAHRLPTFAMASGALATIVIVLTIGFSSIKSNSTYTLGTRVNNAAAAISSGDAVQVIVAFIERFIPEQGYSRK